MGEIADAILNGDMDCETGEWLGNGDGYPRTLQQSDGKISCPVCGKKLKSVGLGNHMKDRHPHEVWKQRRGDGKPLSERVAELETAVADMQALIISLRALLNI